MATVMLSFLAGLFVGEEEYDKPVAPDTLTE
jgi:hypothetical protein